MALVLADRVRDTTTTTGIGTVTLSGTAPVGFQNFTIIGSGNTTYYTIHASFQWEVGIGTYSAVGPSLSRDTVLSSSSAGAKVDFLEGVKDVFVTYPSGEAVYQDGSDIKAGTAVLPVANGGTGATTSTGSGAVVLATSPTLVTPVLGAASATSIANGLGAVGTPSYTFTGDTNTGMWSPAADTLAFSEGGVEAMRIDSSGNVGIGTPTPDANAKLDVSGTIRTGVGATDPGTGGVMYIVGSGSFQTVIGGAAFAVHTGANNARTEKMRIDSSGNVGIGTSAPSFRLDVHNSAANTVRSYCTDATGTSYAALSAGTASGVNSVVYSFSGAGWYGTTTNHPVVFLTNNTEKMRIDSSGNVGIGTTGGDFGRSMRIAARHDQNAATQVVVINGTSGASAAAQFGKIGGTGNSFVDWALRDESGVPFDAFEYGSTVGSVRWLFGGTERMRIDSSGNVGIGMTNPGQRLVVSGADTNGSTIRLANTTAASEVILSLDAGSNGLNQRDSQIRGINNGSNQTSLAFLTANAGTPTEKMRIDNGGNVGIGTSSPATKLEVVDTNEFSLGVGARTSSTQTALLNHPVLLLSNTNTAAGNGLSLRFQIADTGGTSRLAGGVGTVATAKTGSTVTADMYFYVGTSERMRITAGGNVGIGTSTFGTSAATVIGIANGTAPTTSPAGMGQLYVEGGALKYRGSSGTVTTIANA